MQLDFHDLAVEALHRYRFLSGKWQKSVRQLLHDHKRASDQEKAEIAKTIYEILYPESIGAIKWVKP